MNNIIDYYQTVFPNGYNLTIGGKGQFSVVSVSNNDIVSERIKYVHSEETKKKISVRLKQVTNALELRQVRSKTAQDQHDSKKLARFANCVIDCRDFEQYIHPVNSLETGHLSHYKVCINGMRVDFRGKFQTSDELKVRALTFLKQIVILQSKTS